MTVPTGPRTEGKWTTNSFVQPSRQRFGGTDQVGRADGASLLKILFNQISVDGEGGFRAFGGRDNHPLHRA